MTTNSLESHIMKTALIYHERKIDAAMAEGKLALANLQADRMKTPLNNQRILDGVGIER